MKLSRRGLFGAVAGLSLFEVPEGEVVIFKGRTVGASTILTFEEDMLRKIATELHVPAHHLYGEKSVEHSSLRIAERANAMRDQRIAEILCPKTSSPSSGGTSKSTSAT